MEVRLTGEIGRWPSLLVAALLGWQARGKWIDGAMLGVAHLGLLVFGLLALTLRPRFALVMGKTRWLAAPAATPQAPARAASK